MTRRLLTLTLAAFLLAFGAACGGEDDEAAEPSGGGGGGGGAATTLELAADPGGDLSYDKTSLEASSGEVVIEFTNDASIPHNVTLEDVDGGATDTISGSSASLTVTLESGTYTYFCSVGNHRDAGMEGTLTVK